MLRVLRCNFPFRFYNFKKFIIYVLSQKILHISITKDFIIRYYQWKFYYQFMYIYASVMRNDISLVLKNHHTIKSGSRVLGKIVDNILYVLFLQHLKNCKNYIPH